MSVVNRQYAWYTEFSHLGLQASLPGDVGLIAQWMSSETVPLDENAEDGDAWTLAYRYQFNDTFSVAAEWLQIHSERPAWAYNDLAVSQTETQLQLSVLLRVGNR